MYNIKNMCKKTMDSLKGFVNKIWKSEKKMDKNSILVGIAILAIVITGVLILANNPKTNSIGNFSFKGFSLSNIFGKSSAQIGSDVVKYINDNQLAQTPAILVSVSEESGLVKVKIKIGENEFDSYATKDGKFLFPQAIDMKPQKVVEPAVTTKDPATTAKTDTKLKTSDTPELQAFIVARCPYGLQMQRAMADAVKNIPSLSQYMTVRYMGSVSGNTITSMHGDAEAKENLRQICIREEQPTKYWSYAACQMKTGDTTGCETSVGVDSAKLATCISTPSKGIAYAKVDFDLSNQYGVTGSPTLILNGTTISESGYGGRSSDGVKSMICAGFTTQSGFCSTKLNTTSAAASFSETYESSAASNNANSGANGANCAPAQ